MWTGDETSRFSIEPIARILARDWFDLREAIWETFGNLRFVRSTCFCYGGLVLEFFFLLQLAWSVKGLAKTIYVVCAGIMKKRQVIFSSDATTLRGFGSAKCGREKIGFVSDY